MTAVPWLLPGIAVSILVGYAVRQRASSLLGTTSKVAWLIVTATGIIAAATLTPSRDALELGASATGSCDVAMRGTGPLHDLFAFSDASLNILLFLPLGVAIGMLPSTRRMGLILVGALTLPLAIELLQLWLRALDRACQTADLVDNLIGLREERR